MIDDVKIEKIPRCPYCGKPKRKKEMSANIKNLEGKVLKPIILWIDNCNCENEIKIREEIRKEKIKRIKELRKQYKSAGFTRRQLGIRFRHLNNEHKEMFEKWIKEFKPRKSKGMYLYGGVGNGKTTSASCIAKELVKLGYKKIYFSQWHNI